MIDVTGAPCCSTTASASCALPSFRMRSTSRSDDAVSRTAIRGGNEPRQCSPTLLALAGDEHRRAAVATSVAQGCARWDGGSDHGDRLEPAPIMTDAACRSGSIAGRFKGIVTPDSAEICGCAGGGLHQGQERDPRGAGLARVVPVRALICPIERSHPTGDAGCPVTPFAAFAR